MPSEATLPAMTTSANSSVTDTHPAMSSPAISAPAVWLSGNGIAHINEVTSTLTSSRVGSIMSGTYEASRFDSNSNRPIPIRFESDGRTDSKFSNQPHLPSYHKPRSLFNKKNFNRCVFVIEIYFMFMILC